MVEAANERGDAHMNRHNLRMLGLLGATVMVAHPHFDHFYGASVLLRRFPGTPVYASASDIEYIKGDLANTMAQIRARFGATTIPTDILIPQPWPGTRFTVDGQFVDVIAGLQGDVG